MTFETFDQSDEGTWPDQQKYNDKDKYKDKDNDNDKDIDTYNLPENPTYAIFWNPDDSFQIWW